MFQNIVGKITALASSATSGGGIAPDFPYILEAEEVAEWKSSADCGAVWKLFKGKRASGSVFTSAAAKTVDSSTGAIALSDAVSVFVFDKKGATAYRLDAAKNGMLQLKTIRHPNVLKMMCSKETDDKLYFATEEVLPLAAIIGKKPPNVAFIALGLHQLAGALSFLHDRVGMVHGRVAPATVFVSKAGDWRLGGLELAHAHGSEEAAARSLLTAHMDLLPKRYKPKELTSAPTSGIGSLLGAQPIHALDAWCCGCLIHEVFNGRFSRPQQLSKIGRIPVALQSQYKRLLATKPTSRLSVGELQDSGFFEHPLVGAMTFLEQLALKSESEKAGFYVSLSKSIDSFPSERCKYRILPALTHALEHGSSGNAALLSCVLKSASVHLSPAEWRTLIEPVLLALVRSDDRSTRTNVLKQMEAVTGHLDESTVTKQVFPAIVNGFTDASPVLREASVRSSLHLVKKLSKKATKEKLLPLLLKIQATDSEPAIRTNTTIVLGKMAASHLAFAESEAVLVKCFARALQDSFTPARMAGLNAFAATLSRYSHKTLAKQVLPMLCTCTVDPFRTVRDVAFSTLDAGCERLRQHSRLLPDKPADVVVVPKVKPEEKREALSAAAAGVGSALSSASNWAVSAVSSKLAKETQKSDASDYGTAAADSHIGELKTKRVYVPKGAAAAALKKQSGDAMLASLDSLPKATGFDSFGQSTLHFDSKSDASTSKPKSLDLFGDEIGFGSLAVASAPSSAKAMDPFNDMFAEFNTGLDTTAKRKRTPVASIGGAPAVGSVRVDDLFADCGLMATASAPSKIESSPASAPRKAMSRQKARQKSKTKRSKAVTEPKKSAADIGNLDDLFDSW